MCNGVPYTIAEFIRYDSSDRSEIIVAIVGNWGGGLFNGFVVGTVERKMEGKKVGKGKER